MRKFFYLLVVVLTLTACGGKTPQDFTDDDSVVVDTSMIVSEKTEIDDSYINLGNVHCEYYDNASEKYREKKNAVLYGKVLSSNLVYYYVSLKEGGKKYTVTKCDPSNHRGCNGEFQVDDVRYLVYIQLWDDTGSQKENIEGYNSDSHNTQTNGAEQKSQLRVVQRWQNCGACSGSGNCASCGGSGQNLYNMNYYEECLQCHGTRRCQFCGGRGGQYYEALE